MNEYIAKYSTQILSFVRELDCDEMLLPNRAFERGYVKQGDRLYYTALSSMERIFQAANVEDAKRLAKVFAETKFQSPLVKSAKLEDLFRVERIPLD